MAVDECFVEHGAGPWRKRRLGWQREDDELMPVHGRNRRDETFARDASSESYLAATAVLVGAELRQLELLFVCRPIRYEDALFAGKKEFERGIIVPLDG